MIIGIDPGVNIVGYGVVTGTKSKPQIVDYGILHTDQRSRSEGHLRLLEIGLDLTQIIQKYKPTKAVVEDLFFFKNAKTVIQVAQSRGVILYILSQNNVEVVSQTPLQVKQTLTGYGRATKKQIQEMVKRIYSLDEIPKPDDAADALALAWMGL
jgi:crossover junction endodeoxyribonuclease RuvC